MEREKEKGPSGLREHEVALDLTHLKNWSNFEETAYRDFSQQRAERRSNTHRRVDETRHASAAAAEAAAKQAAERAAAPAAEPVVEPVPVEAAPAAIPAQPVVAPVAPAPAVSAPVSLTPAVAEPEPLITKKSSPVEPRQQPTPRSKAAGRAAVAASAAVAVFSLAGGVGKSTICAHLARSLYARGERVLLVDATGHGMLSTYFGSEEEREGLRQFCAPGEVHASVLLMSCETANAQWLRSDVLPLMAHVDRTIFDLNNTTPDLVDGILSQCQVLLVPVVPGPQAAMAVAKMSARLDKLRTTGAKTPSVFYLLNRFEQEKEQDREAMRLVQSQCGDALVPIQLESNDEVEYAFAERMTISDFHTTALLAHQYDQLGSWVRKTLPPTTPAMARRWSEV